MVLLYIWEISHLFFYNKTNYMFRDSLLCIQEISYLLFYNKTNYMSRDSLFIFRRFLIYSTVIKKKKLYVQGRSIFRRFLNYSIIIKQTIYLVNFGGRFCPHLKVPSLTDPLTSSHTQRHIIIINNIFHYLSHTDTQK